MSFPGEGGGMRLPGEGPHEVGIDRKSNGAKRRCSGGSACSAVHEAPTKWGSTAKRIAAWPPTPRQFIRINRSEAAA